MADLTDAWTPVDDMTFTLRLKKPFSLPLDALAKPSLNVLLFPPKTDRSQMSPPSIWQSF